jgi:hypothetical protein
MRTLFEHSVGKGAATIRAVNTKRVHSHIEGKHAHLTFQTMGHERNIERHIFETHDSKGQV